METRPGSVWLAVALGLWAGCGGTSGTSHELGGTIGPAGGTLRGEVGSEFEGVELAIPAGALAAATPVHIALTFDDTPLPALALRAGMQFAIEPAGTVLATPATLTVPVNTGTVQQFFQTAGDVKVWLRDGAGWTLQEPSATADGSVSIPVATFTTAAAGIRLVSAPPTCLATACRALTSTCSSASGFCIRTIAIPPNAQLTENTYVVDASAAYYPTRGPSNDPRQIAVARLDLTSGSVTFTTALEAAANLAGLAVDGDGSVWAGLLFPQHANARFPFRGAVIRFDLDSTTVGRGAIYTSAGTLIRFVSGMSTARVGGVTAAFGPFRASSTGILAPDPSPGVDAYFTTGGDGAVVRIDAKTGNQLASIKPSHAPALIAAARDGTASVPPTLATLSLSGLEYARKGASSFTPVALPFQAFSMDVDASGGVWITGHAAEIYYLRPDQGLESALIGSSTDPNSLDYQHSLPLAVRALPDGSCLVLLNGSQLAVIRRSN